jgi:hypothetical protein
MNAVELTIVNQGKRKTASDGGLRTSGFRVQEESKKAFILW